MSVPASSTIAPTPEKWNTVFHVAGGIVLILIALSMVISFLWNQTIPSIFPSVQRLDWRKALGLLLLLSLFHMYPVLL